VESLGLGIDFSKLGASLKNSNETSINVPLGAIHCGANLFIPLAYEGVALILSTAFRQHHSVLALISMTLFVFLETR
jgi:hypothetical protein